MNFYLPVKEQSFVLGEIFHVRLNQIILCRHEQRSRHSDSSVSPVRKPTTSTKGQASPLADRKERKPDKLSRCAVDAARQTMSV